ncbi:zf-HC2 domain-containing protein [Actinopolymorpha sp. B9G3]|uniref:anti-sigma factor family protein n=1 Tax=Actinopolymorpha sp. B9G3 TaxID=3158970 RepID=UPI0032D96858
MTTIDHTDHGPHTDVAAYALGLLEDADRQAFDSHLAECARCQAELAEFAGLAGALRDVDPAVLDSSAVAGPVDGAVGGPVDGAVDGPVDGAEPDGAVLELRRRGRLAAPGVVGASADRAGRTRRAGGPHGARGSGGADGTNERRWIRPDRLLAAAAAVVLLMAGAVGGTFIADRGRDTTATPDSVHRPAGELLLTGERFATTDRATGTTGVIGVESRKWGTHLAMELRGVHGPLSCQLIAVSRDGQRQVAMSWKVPPEGYGVPGAPDPLVLHGSTSIPREDVAGVEVRTAEGKTILRVSL